MTAHTPDQRSHGASLLTGATLIAASIMHLAERHAQPDKFGTIPDAMWWAIVTLGTIGYGEGQCVTPSTIRCQQRLPALSSAVPSCAKTDTTGIRLIAVNPTNNQGETFLVQWPG
jgi:Ion channel